MRSATCQPAPLPARPGRPGISASLRGIAIALILVLFGLEVTASAGAILAEDPAHPDVTRTDARIAALTGGQNAVHPHVEEREPANVASCGEVSSALMARTRLPIQPEMHSALPARLSEQLAAAPLLAPFVLPPPGAQAERRALLQVYRI